MFLYVLLRSWVNTGAKRCIINVSNIFPHATTISGKITEVDGKLTRQFFSYLNSKINFLWDRGEREILSSSHVSTDHYWERSFTAVVVHYFDDNWNLIFKLFFTCTFPNKSKTVIIIRKEIIILFQR